MNFPYKTQKRARGCQLCRIMSRQPLRVERQKMSPFWKWQGYNICGKQENLRFDPGPPPSPLKCSLGSYTCSASFLVSPHDPVSVSSICHGNLVIKPTLTPLKNLRLKSFRLFWVLEGSKSGSKFGPSRTQKAE